MNLLSLVKAESYTKGTILSVVYNIVSKGILFLLTVIIARYFGSNIKTDIYFFVFATMILFSSFINSVDVSVIIPESMRLREHDGDEKAAVFLNFFLLGYLAIGILFTLAMFLFGTKLFGTISKFSDDDIQVYRNYFLLGSLFFIFHVLTTYLNSILTSLKYFSLPLIVGAIKNCIVIVCVIMLRADYDVLGVIIGGLISYVVNLCLQIYVMHKIAGWKFVFKIPNIRKSIWRNLIYAELGQITTVASSLFPLYLLSGFGSGIISIMNYGKNIADIPNTVITAQLTNVAGIKLNQQAAEEDYTGMNAIFLKTGKLLVFLLVPIGFYLFVFAKPVVELFYQSGIFKGEALNNSAVFLRLLAVTVFILGINAAVTRVLIAMQAIRQAFLYELALNILLIAVIWACTKQFGSYGYPYGVIITNLVNCYAMYFLCRKLAAHIDYTALLRYTCIVVLANAGIAAGLYLLYSYVNLNCILQIISGFLLYALILLVFSSKFKLDTGLLYVYHYVKEKFN
jgi:putative peptidoglycan lipid II flippase